MERRCFKKCSMKGIRLCIVLALIYLYIIYIYIYYLFYALIPFIEHFLKQRRSIY